VNGLDEYRALVAKVEENLLVLKEEAERSGNGLSCHHGCTGCCQVRLSVSPVEAAAVQEAVMALPESERHSLLKNDDPQSGACVMLRPDAATGLSGCAIYESRPLVCRSQGLPLQYPEGLIPAESVRLRTKAGSVTWCPLNFIEAAPPATAILDAARVDQILAVVNHRFAQKTDVSAETRFELVDLVEPVEPVEPVELVH
jgi:hypothetical protein